MQTVTDIAGTKIVLNNRVGYKLEIDAVSMSGNAVSGDPQMLAFPAVNAIGRFLFTDAGSTECISGEDAVMSLLAIDTEKAVFKNILQNSVMPALPEAKGGYIVVAGSA